MNSLVTIQHWLYGGMATGLGEVAGGDLKAIFTSGYSEQFIRGREETDKDVPLLPKPYRRQKLLDVVRRVLDAVA